VDATRNLVPGRYPSNRNQIIKTRDHQCVAKLYLDFGHNRHLGMVKRDTAANSRSRVRNLLKDLISSLRPSIPEIRYQESKRLLCFFWKASLYRRKGSGTQIRILPSCHYCNTEVISEKIGPDSGVEMPSGARQSVRVVGGEKHSRSGVGVAIEVPQASTCHVAVTTRCASKSASRFLKKLEGSRNGIVQGVAYLSAHLCGFQLEFKIDTTTILRMGAHGNRLTHSCYSAKFIQSYWLQAARRKPEHDNIRRTQPGVFPRDLLGHRDAISRRKCRTSWIQHDIWSVPEHTNGLMLPVRAAAYATGQKEGIAFGVYPGRSLYINHGQKSLQERGSARNEVNLVATTGFRTSSHVLLPRRLGHAVLPPSLRP